ncbi:hypothetical protein V393_00001, partial [Staphylococcus aureus T36127]
YNSVQVGGAPTQRLAESQLTIVCKLGWSPDTEKLAPQFLQTMQVGGAPTQKLAKSQLTIVCKLGWDDEINFAKISFLSHSQKDSSRIISIWKYLTAVFYSNSYIFVFMFSSLTLLLNDFFIFISEICKDTINAIFI